MLEFLGRFFIHLILCTIGYIIIRLIYDYNELTWQFNGHVFWLGFSWAIIVCICYKISQLGSDE